MRFKHLRFATPAALPPNVSGLGQLPSAEDVIRSRVSQGLSVGTASLCVVRREQLSKAEARRIALAAQGFGVPKRERPLTMRDVQAVTSRLAQFQIDSINVVTQGALHAAVLAAWTLRPRPPGTRCLSTPTSAFRVLGPCGQSDRRLPAADCSGFACSRDSVTSGLEWSEWRSKTLI